MKIKILLIIIMVFTSNFLLFGANTTNLSVTPTPTLLSQTKNIVQPQNQNTLASSYTPVTSVPRDGSWVNFSAGRMRYADTPTPALVNTPGTGDLQIDINNNRVKFNGQPPAIDPQKFSKMGELLKQQTFGYLYVVTKGRPEEQEKIEESMFQNGIQRHVYYFNQAPTDVELSDLEPGQDYYAQIRAVGNYRLNTHAGGKDTISDIFFAPYITKAALIKTPNNFMQRKHSLGQDIHVSLADLYANRDKYDGKVIEVEGYLDRGGDKQITEMRYKSSGGIGNGNYLLYGGVSWNTKTKYNYIDFICYFYKVSYQVPKYDPQTNSIKPKIHVRYVIDKIITVSISKR
jgi:hypothetical protein